MSDSILISILIPAYKSVFLGECLESILLQTYTNWEVIILDDCSPNHIEKIVSKYNDDRIHYYRNRNRVGIINLIDNWNYCLEKAKGEYVICMGDDDKLLPNCLNDYIEKIKEYPFVSLFHIQTLFINETSMVIDIQMAAPFRESVYSLIINVWKGRETRIGDFLFKTKELRNIGGFYKTACAWHADRITAFLMAKENGVVNISTPGFLFRISSLAITSNTNVTKEKINAWRHINKWYKTFLDEVPYDINDSYYYDYLKNNIDSMIHKRMLGDLERDVFCSLGNLLFWIINRKKNGLTKRDLLTLFANYFRSIFYHAH